MAPSAFVRPPTAQEVIRDEIVRRLSTGEIAVGASIRQDTIARELGVSRVPVREALKELVGMGVVEYVPRHGHRARVLSPDALEELMLYRQVLETAVAHRVIDHVDDATVAELEQLAKTMEHDDADRSLSDLRELTGRFHHLIFASSQLPFFVEQIEHAWRRMRAYRQVLCLPREDHERMHAEHRAMIDALRNRDATALIAVQDLHRQRATGRTSTATRT